MSAPAASRPGSLCICRLPGGHTARCGGCGLGHLHLLHLSELRHGLALPLTRQDASAVARTHCDSRQPGHGQSPRRPHCHCGDGSCQRAIDAAPCARTAEERWWCSAAGNVAAGARHPSADCAAQRPSRQGTLSIQGRISSAARPGMRRRDRSSSWSIHRTDVCAGARQRAGRRLLRFVALDHRACVEQHALAAKTLVEPGLPDEPRARRGSAPPARRRRRAPSRGFSPSISACNAEYSMSGTRLMSSASTRGLCWLNQRIDLVRHVLHIDEEQAPFPAARSAGPRRSRRQDVPVTAAQHVGAAPCGR